MDHRLPWIWAQEVFGPGSATPWHIHKRYPGGLEAFCRAEPRQWRELDYISEQQSLSLSMIKLETALVKLEYAERLGWGLVTPECEQYPDLLRNIPDPPAVLYSKGAPLERLAGPKIAMAGARKASSESVAAAKHIAFQMAEQGAVIVTGEAVGIDSAALTGALQANGTAVCVLPVDLDSAYIAKTARLRQDVLDSGGTILTEYFSQRTPGRGTFQERNRIITGLCGKVVLIQAEEKSGTMIYGRHARKQGRKLYVYPGPPGAPGFEGSRILLREGAVPVLSGDDVLDGSEFSPRKPEARPPVSQRRTALQSAAKEAPKAGESAGVSSPSPEPPAPAKTVLPPEQRAILNLLGEGQKNVNELIRESGLPSGKLLRLLTRMEIQGDIEALAGKMYRRRRS